MCVCVCVECGQTQSSNNTLDFCTTLELASPELWLFLKEVAQDYFVFDDLQKRMGG